MRARLTFAALLLAAAAGAAALRLPRLGLRPMHADEAVQAARFRTLWQQGRYVYNPDEFHGPTLSYATLPSPRLHGQPTFAETTAETYRVVPALFGVGLVVLIWLLGDGLGKPAALAAALLAALSPAMVYYSRDYIHETLLAFFTLAAIAAGWRYARSGGLAWCVAAGFSVGLMQATKETAALAYLAAGGAFALVALVAPAGRMARRRPAEPQPAARPQPARPAWHLAIGLSAAGLVAVVLLSSFLTNPRGPVDGVLTYAVWLRRAGAESIHTQPWYFYLHRLTWWRFREGPLWSEGLILALAAAGVVAGWVGRRSLGAGADARFVRWLGVYTVILAVAYSAIPYKTPWCLVQMLVGLVLLGGVGAAALVRLMPTRPLKAVVAVILLGAAGQLGWQSYRGAFLMTADPGNPYVYAQTLPDAERLARDVEQLAEAAPEGHGTTLKVVWNDAYYWPLPWYLRRFERVEYWTKVPADADAPVVISAASLDVPLTEQLRETHLMTDYYALRPGVLAQLWVRIDLWEAHLKRLGRL